MAYWLYQMSSNDWPSGEYKVEVWEAEHTNWQIHRKVPGNKSPETGDTVILFYAPAGESDPGIYGWAVVIRFDGIEIRFKPSSPSDYMKMNPVWDDDVKNIINRIRGRVAQGTLWEIEESLFKQLRQKIVAHLYGVTS
jgi:hypothetical protein